MESQMNRWRERRTDGKMNKQTDGWMDRTGFTIFSGYYLNPLIQCHNQSTYSEEITLGSWNVVDGSLFIPNGSRKVHRCQAI